MEDKDIIKHSAAIHISNDINLFQRKTWNVLLANAYDELESKEIHEVSVNELLDVLGIKTRNFDHIKKSVEALAKTSITWNVIGKDKDHEWGIMNLLAEAKMKNGKLSYAYPPTLRKLLHHPNWYAKIKLSMQNKFITKHGLTLFEICFDAFIEKWGYGTTDWIDIEKFKEVMGLNAKGENGKKYVDFRDLNKYVIKPALKEVNKANIFLVDIEYKKEGRKVVAVKFDMCEIKGGKALKELPQGAPEYEPKSPELLDRLQNYFCLSEDEAFEIIYRYDEDYITGNLEVVEKKYKSGKIRDNLAGYTVKALKDDYRQKKSAFDSDKENKERNDKILKDRMYDLESDYNKLIKERVNKLIEDMTDEDKQMQISEFEEEKINKVPVIANIYRKRKLESPLFKAQFENYLVKKLEVPDLMDFETFAKTQGLRVEKDANERYQIVERCD